MLKLIAEYYSIHATEYSPKSFVKLDILFGFSCLAHPKTTLLSSKQGFEEAMSLLSMCSIVVATCSFYILTECIRDGTAWFQSNARSFSDLIAHFTRPVPAKEKHPHTNTLLLHCRQNAIRDRFFCFRSQDINDDICALNFDSSRHSICFHSYSDQFC